MGKFNPMIVLYSDSENSCDSLQLIDPVTNLSLEHIEKRKSNEDFDDQSKQLEKLHLNDRNGNIEKRTKKINQSRHHPYTRPTESKSKIEIKKRDRCDMKFLKSLGYLQYSLNKTKTNKISLSNHIDPFRQLFLEINQTIESTFSKYIKSNEQSKDPHYVCTRRLR